jgi:hypothetical protein
MWIGGRNLNKEDEWNRRKIKEKAGGIGEDVKQKSEMTEAEESLVELEVEKMG